MRKRDELTDPSSCMSRARDDEWLFVLLGRDLAAPAAVRAWIEERIRLGKNRREDAQIVEAERWVKFATAEQSFKPGIYRVTSGTDAGALVRLHFINAAGNADCRYHGDHGRNRDGEIVVVLLENLDFVCPL